MIVYPYYFGLNLVLNLYELYNYNLLSIVLLKTIPNLCVIVFAINVFVD